MQDNEDKQTDLHDADDKVVAHEMSPVVECLPTIVEKDHTVDTAVNDQE